jgi:hypothetical protein
MLSAATREMDGYVGGCGQQGARDRQRHRVGLGGFLDGVGRVPDTMPASATTGSKRTSVKPASRSASCQMTGHGEATPRRHKVTPKRLPSPAASSPRWHADRRRATAEVAGETRTRSG